MKRALIAVLILVFCVSTATAATITLRWDRNNEPDLDKYTCYWRAPGGEYIRNTEAPFYHEDVTVLDVNSTDDLQHPREVTVSLAGNEWEFVVTASDKTGNQSGQSNQVDTVKPQPPGHLTIWEIIWAFVKKVFNWFCQEVSMAKNTPKRDGSGKGKRLNRNDGGCTKGGPGRGRGGGRNKGGRSK